MKSVRVWALAGALASVTVPSVFLLPGCSGGSSSGVANPTPVPTNLATDVPVNLGSGRTGLLTLIQSGSTLGGTLEVQTTTALKVGKPGQLFNFTVPIGTYHFSGTVSVTRSFSVTGTFPVPIGQFTITGTVPTGSQTGTFTITANGQTVTGVLPAITGSTATPTSTAPGAGPVTGTLNFSSVSGNYNGTSTALDGGLGAFSLSNSASGQALTVTANFQDGNTTRNVNIVLTKVGNFAAGESFTLGQVGPGGFQTGTYAEITTPAVTGPIFAANGGQVQIQSLSANSITVNFVNASFNASAVGSLNATGSFLLNGTLTLQSAT